MKKFYPSVLLIFPLATCLACSRPPQNAEQLKEKTADATAEMKSDARAVASGIREGWSRDKPLDLNSASKDDLMSLPGITNSQANRIIASRPYRQPDDLVSRHILTKTEYEPISDRVVAKL
jgi:DNA uptake protein ComE-like DNA-binding protein